ncbi:unnamed protein product [Cuscuta campestris]|uniref:Transposase (putative) gypsy type domain-containing protein n=1 Tax=Cuscuta campestris TaxID=132261 RepID=A0A484KIV5_9ASTE|nr:unnamed protein product [Cuscuta campestris]
MIVSYSDSATPSSNSRQADQSAPGRNPGHTQSPQPSPSAVSGHKRRRLRKQFPCSTPVDEGSRVGLDENIMALCHCQITDRGFADATDMVGPSIEVMRPTSTQTALDAPSGFFTVHLASLKKGLRFPLHPLLIELLNVVDLLPCQLVPNSHRYIASYLVRCKVVGVKPTLDHFLFTFKLTKGHKDWASYASLSERSSKLFASDKKGSTKDWKPFFVFVSTGPESPFTGSGRPSFRRIPCPPPDATLLSITRQLCNKGVMNIKEVVTEETLAGLGFEFVQDELRHQPDLLRDIPGGHQPDQLKDIPEEGLDCGPFGEEMDGDLLLSRITKGRKRKREAKGQGKRSSSHHGESLSREPAVIVVENQDDATLETGTMTGHSPPHSVRPGDDLARSSQGVVSERPPSPPAVTYEVATGGRSTRLCIPPLPQSLGDVQLETLITLPAEDQARISAGSEDDLDNMVLLRLSQATLGMIEVVGRRRGHQAALGEALKTSEARQKELQEEVARLTRELGEKENRCAALAAEKTSHENRCVALEADKASLSLEVESVSSRVVELEGEKSDLIQQLEVERSDRVRHAEEAVESFKSSPDFTMVAMERMEELRAAWLKTEPGAQWMVKEGTKSFNCGLFRAQQVFRDRLAQLPKGFSLPDLGFPPPCRSLAEFDPSPYLDGGSSSASEEEEEEEEEGGQGDQNPGASLATTPISLNLSDGPAPSSPEPASSPQSVNSNDWGGGLDPYEFCRRLPRRQWPSVRLPPLPPNPYEDFSEVYKALSANRLPDGRIDWDAPCPLHSLQCMAWESFHDEHLPLLEHECTYYASLERWTSESRTNSPVRLKEEVVLGEELGPSLPRLACRSPPRKTPRRPGVARAASGSPSSSR